MTQRLDIWVEQPGAQVGRKSERLIITHQNKTLAQHPMRSIAALRLAAQGVNVSTDALTALMEHGVQVDLIDFAHRPLARITSPHLTGQIRTRRAQLAAFDTTRGFSLAQALVAEKLRAQRRLITYVRRRAEDDDMAARAIANLTAREQEVHALRPAPLPICQPTLMGKEGAGAAAYWRALAETLTPALPFRREKRGAVDLPNVMLNYGYAILMSRVWGMIELAGLDPYGGFLHADQAGRPGLVLDMMEPWRPLVDDAVFSRLRRVRGAMPHTFDDEQRRGLVDDVLGRLQSLAVYQGRDATVQGCMQRSVRQVAAFLREEQPLRLYRWDVRGPKAPGDDAPPRSPVSVIPL